jgi:hypothetical protein
MATWASQWKAAKTVFEAKTGQKKPSAATMTAVRKGSGLEDALRTCDTEFAAIGTETDSAKKQALVQKFTIAVKTFDTKVAAYEKVLVANILQAERKLLQPELTILWKQLYAVSASMKAALGKLTVAAQRSKGDEIIANKLLVSMVGAVAKAREFAVNVTKAQGPAAPKAFNDSIVRASRPITVHFDQLERLRAKGYKFPQGDPTNLAKLVAPWAQNKRKLAPAAPPDHVKREVGAFVQALNGVEKWAKG